MLVDEYGNVVDDRPDAGDIAGWSGLGAGLTTAAGILAARRGLLGKRAQDFAYENLRHPEWLGVAPSQTLVTETPVVRRATRTPITRTPTDSPAQGVAVGTTGNLVTDLNRPVVGDPWDTNTVVVSEATPVQAAPGEVTGADARALRESRIGIPTGVIDTSNVGGQVRDLNAPVAVVAEAEPNRIQWVSRDPEAPSKEIIRRGEAPTPVTTVKELAFQDLPPFEVEARMQAFANTGDRRLMDPNFNLATVGKDEFMVALELEKAVMDANGNIVSGQLRNPGGEVARTVRDDKSGVSFSDDGSPWNRDVALIAGEGDVTTGGVATGQLSSAGYFDPDSLFPTEGTPKIFTNEKGQLVLAEEVDPNYVTPEFGAGSQKGRLVGGVAETPVREEIYDLAYGKPATSKTGKAYMPQEIQSVYQGKLPVHTLTDLERVAKPIGVTSLDPSVITTQPMKVVREGKRIGNLERTGKYGPFNNKVYEVEDVTVRAPLQVVDATTLDPVAKMGAINRVQLRDELNSIKLETGITDYSALAQLLDQKLAATSGIRLPVLQSNTAFDFVDEIIGRPTTRPARRRLVTTGQQGSLTKVFPLSAKDASAVTDDRGMSLGLTSSSVADTGLSRNPAGAPVLDIGYQAAPPDRWTDNIFDEDAVLGSANVGSSVEMRHARQYQSSDGTIQRPIEFKPQFTGGVVVDSPVQKMGQIASADSMETATPGVPLAGIEPELITSTSIFTAPSQDFIQGYISKADPSPAMVEATQSHTPGPYDPVSFMTGTRPRPVGKVSTPEVVKVIPMSRRAVLASDPQGVGSEIQSLRSQSGAIEEPVEIFRSTDIETPRLTTPSRRVADGDVTSSSPRGEYLHQWSTIPETSVEQTASLARGPATASFMGKGKTSIAGDINVPGWSAIKSKPGVRQTPIKGIIVSDAPRPTVSRSKAREALSNVPNSAVARLLNQSRAKLGGEGTISSPNIDSVSGPSTTTIRIIDPAVPFTGGGFWER